MIVLSNLLLLVTFSRMLHGQSLESFTTLSLMVIRSCLHLQGGK